MSNHSKEVRSKIIRVARNKFFSNGIRNVTMDEIASDTGIGKGTLYEYFSSKESLVDKIVRIKKDEVMSYCDEIYRKFESPTEINFIELLIFIIGDSSKILSEIKVPFHKDIKKLNIDIYEKMTDMDNMVSDITRTLIEKGKNQNMVKEDINNEVLLEIVSTIIKNMIINHQTATKLNISNKEVFHTFISVLFDGTLSDEGKKQYMESQGREIE